MGSIALPVSGVNGQLAAIRRRTRNGVGLSLAVHALLLVFLKLHAPDPSDVEGLVEITWIEAPAPAPAPVAVATVSRQSPKGTKTPAKPAPQAEREHFARPMQRSENAPKPQDTAATRDAVRERLASLTSSAAETRTQVAALLPTTDAARPTLAAVPSTPNAEPSPRSLARGEERRPTPAPAELVRSAAVAAPAMTALARLVEEPVSTSSPPTTPATAFPPREVLAGVSLAGPVADRALVRSRLPVYPEWAKQDAVEGSVRLRFVVRPDGGVRESILIERTSGHEDFDRNAEIALLEWRFEALPGSTGDQWGSITLDYRLDSLH